jgi:hypothetical protein
MRGYLLRKGGNEKSKRRLFSSGPGKESLFFSLIGSSLHAFQNELESELLCTHELKSAVVFENIESNKESLTVRLENGDAFKLYCKVRVRRFHSFIIIIIFFLQKLIA